MSLIEQTIDALLNINSSYIKDRITELKREYPEMSVREITDALDDELTEDEYKNAATNSLDLAAGFADDAAAAKALLQHLPITLLQDTFNNRIWFDLGGYGNFYDALQEVVEKIVGSK